MEEIKVNGKLELEDFMDFQFRHFRKRFLNKFLLWALVIALIPFAADLLITGKIELHSFSTYLKPAVILSSFLVLMLAGIYFSAKKAFNTDVQIRKGCEYTFNASGILRSAENSEIRLAWEELYNYDESKKNIFIYSAPQKAYIIPKRHLQATEIDFIKSFLSTRIKKTSIANPFKFSWPVRISLFALPIVVGVFIGLYRNGSEKYYDAGYAKEQNKDYSGAIIEYTNAINADPSYADAYLHRGFAKGMTGDYTGQLEDCSRAAALDHKSGEAYENIAYAKYQLGDTTGACNDLHTAVSLGCKRAEKEIQQHCR